VESRLIVLDTDILIDVSRDVAGAVDALQRITDEDEPAITIITQMELVVGCRNQRELRALDLFLQRFRILGLSEPISEKAIELLRRYRLTHGLLLPDSLIAASVLLHGLPFLSKNQKHFRFIEGLKLLPYPSAAL
jgi:predicted nucleic acid-binding protein